MTHPFSVVHAGQTQDHISPSERQTRKLTTQLHAAGLHICETTFSKFSTELPSFLQQKTEISSTFGIHSPEVTFRESSVATGSLQKVTRKFF